MNEGDWICSDPNCGSINFARRTSCYRCNKDSGKAFKKKLGTEIGKSAAEKSRGLFNADDWQCNKCANVNWARRQTCNVCNAPKFGEVEARTGYGGGYNERGIVEYRRREPSSDDEYDEFGRKKRKRRDEQDKVGITEGPVNKKLPPTMQQKELKLDYVMPTSNSKMSQIMKKEHNKIQGSLSDGSVCEVPIVKKPFRKYQQHNQSNNNIQDNKLPYYKINGLPLRKRFNSTGDKDNTASSGYETSSKKSRYDNNVPTMPKPIAKTYSNPVMENRVSSTNNDFVQKFSGQVEEMQVKYSIEEKVKAAAFAIVYNNCKIATKKFEAFYSKPAPPFPTIFSWRQQLLKSGCIVDTHVDISNKDAITPSAPSAPSLNNDIKAKSKVPQRVPNPDEIPILSDSDYDYERSPKQNTSINRRSISAETLIVGLEGESKHTGESLSAPEDQDSHTRSHSASTHCRSRSSSCDSRDMNYSDSDREAKSKLTNTRNVSVTISNATKQPVQSIHDSDSCSLSYNSEDEDFLSRSFGNGKKVRRKIKRRTIPAKSSTYTASDDQLNKGYITVNSSAQSPLVTGNIYTSNLRNMAVKQRKRESNVVDTDGCSSEYVPTKSGATAKKNYQEFKNNVKNKGFWVKGNRTTLIQPKSRLALDPINATVTCMQNKLQSYTLKNQGYMSAQLPAIQKREECSKNNKETDNKYLSYEKPFQSTCAKTSEVSPIYRNQTIDTGLLAQNQTIQNKDNVDNTLHTIQPGKTMTTSLFGKPVPNVFSDVTKDKVNNSLSKTDKNDSYGCKAVDIKHCGFEQFSASRQDTLGSFNTTSQNVYPVAQLNTYEDKSLPLLHSKVPINTTRTYGGSTQITSHRKSVEDSCNIFNLVQSTATNKNRSITDLFNIHEEKSPEQCNDLDKYDKVRKMYETEWDEDDDALYNTDSPESSAPKKSAPSQNNGNLVTQSPLCNTTHKLEMDVQDNNATLNNITMDTVRERCESLLDLFDDIKRNKETPVTPNKQTSHKLTFVDQNLQKNISQTLSHTIVAPGLMFEKSDPIPIELSNEIKRISEENQINDNKVITPPKRVKILESICIRPKSTNCSSTQSSADFNTRTSPTTNMYRTQDLPFRQSSEPTSPNKVLSNDTSTSNVNSNVQNSNAPPVVSSEVNRNAETAQNPPQIDLTNLLDGINTDTIWLALQNLQQLHQNSNTSDNTQCNAQSDNSSENTTQNVETINLTNDEEWERESNRDGSIERQLAKLDGNTGDTPFLSDIFDPGPVIIPHNIAQKLNLNIRNPDEDKNETQTNFNENAPVIGNFKSFALPKPILLNRLKLTVKTPDKNYKKSGEEKRNKRKKKGKGGTSQEGGDGEQDEEESGDEADLAKYDLWGSDEEQGHSSKNDVGDKNKDGDASKDAGSESGDKNGKSPSADSKSSKRRSRSSSSSSTSSSSSSSSHSSTNAPKNKFDDFNLNSERESVHSSPKGRKSRSRSRSPRARSSNPPARRKSRDSRSAGESRSSRDKDKCRDRERRDRSRGVCDERKQRRYSRDGKVYSARGRHR